MGPNSERWGSGYNKNSFVLKVRIKCITPKIHNSHLFQTAKTGSDNWIKLGLFTDWMCCEAYTVDCNTVTTALAVFTSC